MKNPLLALQSSVGAPVLRGRRSPPWALQSSVGVPVLRGRSSPPRAFHSSAGASVLRGRPSPPWALQSSVGASVLRGRRSPRRDLQCSPRIALVTPTHMMYLCTCMPDLLLAEDFNKVTMAMTFTVPLLRDYRASRVGDVFQKSHGIYRGAGITLKLEGGGGGKRRPGSKVTPTQN